MAKAPFGQFCPIPFLQLQLNPLGNVSACCFSGEHKVGNVAEAPLEEIWNGPEMRRWRREFLDGKVKICEAPMKNFQCHKNYQHLNDHVELREVQTAMPRRLDLRLNGKCNLECVMCDVWSQPNGLYDESDFWKIGPTKIFPHLLEVDMLGGEPFIQKDTYRFIDEVTKVNPRCTWGFITNGQYKFNPHLRGHLDRIRLRHVHISIDSVDPAAYARIRRNGILQKTLDTVESFVAYRDERRKRGDWFAIFGSMCVQKDNWDGIPSFLEFCDAREIQPIFQVLIGREHLSLGALAVSDLRQMRAGLEPLRDGKFGEGLSGVFAEIDSRLRA